MLKEFEEELQKPHSIRGDCEESGVLFKIALETIEIKDIKKRDKVYLFFSSNYKVLELVF